MSTIVHIPDELRDKIDAVRGDVPRERWVRRQLETLFRSMPEDLSDRAKAYRSMRDKRDSLGLPQRTETRDEAIQERIAQWHALDHPAMSLHEYLGLSWEDYKAWVERTEDPNWACGQPPAEDYRAWKAQRTEEER